MLVRYRGKIIKVSWRDPGQNGGFWKPFLVLWNVSLPENVEKWTFRCHVRPNRAKICCAVFVRSVRSPWTPPDLPNFNLNYEKNSFCEKLDFPNFPNSFFARDGPVLVFIFYFGLEWTVEHQRSCRRKLGSPRTISELFCLQVTFQEIPKTWNTNFPSVSCERSRRNSGQSMGNRPPDIIRPSFSSFAFITTKVGG